MENYRIFIMAQGLPLHPSNNKLRDVEQKYAEHGHMFSFNKEILGSFDVCGSCEAHALILGLEAGLATSVEKSTSLFELDYEKYRKNNINFYKCPKEKLID